MIGPKHTWELWKGISQLFNCSAHRSTSSSIKALLERTLHRPAFSPSFAWNIISTNARPILNEPSFAFHSMKKHTAAKWNQHYMPFANSKIYPTHVRTISQLKTAKQQPFALHLIDQPLDSIAKKGTFHCSIPNQWPIIPSEPSAIGSYLIGIYTVQKHTWEQILV